MASSSGASDFLGPAACGTVVTDGQEVGRYRVTTRVTADVCCSPGRGQSKIHGGRRMTTVRVRMNTARARFSKLEVGA